MSRVVARLDMVLPRPAGVERDKEACGLKPSLNPLNRGKPASWISQRGGKEVHGVLIWSQIALANWSLHGTSSARRYQF